MVLRSLGFDPAGLEYLELTTLADVCERGKSYSTVAIVQRFQVNPFMRSKALQLLLTDETTPEFQIILWGLHEDLHRRLLRGSLVLIEDFQMSTWDPGVRAGNFGHTSRIHLLASTFNRIEHLVVDLLPTIHGRVQNLVTWAHRNLMLISTPVPCVDLSEMQSRHCNLFDITLLITRNELFSDRNDDYRRLKGTKGPIDLSCKDQRDTPVILRLWNSDAHLEMIRNLAFRSDPPHSVIDGVEDDVIYKVKCTHLGREIYAGKIIYVYTGEESTFSILQTMRRAVISTQRHQQEVSFPANSMSEPRFI